eukprot:TRINITY_DN1892_c0_g1_i1.p1 TRINITY_DN1892_c0_g1~~TRINITY_DN1892_c0_g1_i1.p1  ORF type:complete len:687 (+),score=129.06 TRINITY_DN1892_c0_g1_i1:89-2149(+)
MPTSPRATRRVLRPRNSKTTARHSSKPQNETTGSKIPKPARRNAVPDWSKIHAKEDKKKADRIARNKRPTTKPASPKFSRLGRTRSNVSDPDLGARIQKQSKVEPDQAHDQKITAHRHAMDNIRMTRSRAAALRHGEKHKDHRTKPLSAPSPNNMVKSKQPLRDISSSAAAAQPFSRSRSFSARSLARTTSTIQNHADDDFADAASLASILDNTGVQGYETKRATLATSTTTSSLNTLNTQDYLKAGRERLSMYQQRQQRMSMYLKQAAVNKGLATEEAVKLNVAKDGDGNDNEFSTNAREALSSLSVTTPVANRRRATYAPGLVPFTPKEEIARRSNTIYNGPIRVEVKGNRQPFTTPSRRMTMAGKQAHTVHGKGQASRPTTATSSASGSRSVGRLSLYSQRHRSHANALATSPTATARPQQEAASPEQAPIKSLFNRFEAEQRQAAAPVRTLALSLSSSECHDTVEEEDDLDEDAIVQELAREEEKIRLALEAAAKANATAIAITVEDATSPKRAAVSAPGNVVEPCSPRIVSSPSVVRDTTTPVVAPRSAFKSTSSLFQRVEKPKPAAAPSKRSAFAPLKDNTSAVEPAEVASADTMYGAEDELNNELSGLWKVQLSRVFAGSDRVPEDKKQAHALRQEACNPLAQHLAGNTLACEPLCHDFTRSALDINRTCVLLEVPARQ